MYELIGILFGVIIKTLLWMAIIGLVVTFGWLIINVLLFMGPYILGIIFFVFIINKLFYWKK